MKKIICLFLIFFFFCLSSCAGASTGKDGYYKYAYEKMITPGDILEPEQGDQDIYISPGQITASAYNDNEHFDFWKGLLSNNNETKGLFYDYYNNYAFNTKNRIKLTFPKEYYVNVKLYKNGEIEFETITDRNGIAYIFFKEERESYSINVKYNIGKSLVEFNDVIIGDKEYTTNDLNAYMEVTNTSNNIDLMFVIDTTGSMGDEIKYLKAEIDDVISKVKLKNENVNIRLALMFYRDKEDIYLTKYFDFTTDIQEQKNNLAKQDADGGGDFEEAVDIAMYEALNKSWQDDSTKILIHVADAPSHDIDVQSWNDTVKKMAAKGIRIITVASSGIDKKTEYFFRCECLLTNGIYTYITNDSGIGGDHIEATTEEDMEVELLNSMLVRLINGIHTGTFSKPIYYKQDLNKAN